MFKKSLLAIVACAATAHAQGTETGTPAPAPAPAPMPGTGGGDAFQKGTMGVTFALDLTSALGTTTLGERVPTIGLSYFLSDNAALRLTAGLNIHKEQITSNAVPPTTTDTTVVGFALGAGYRMYKPVKVGRVHPYLEPAAVLAWPDTSQSATVLLGLGANLDFTNSFKNIQFATASTLAANLYWK